ncbi:DNA-binding response regulator [bacterium D16-51]|nr:DNA-binding response regulator [bacterium D16-59]RKI57980.1 DNA-binding response regulator [bacterium D16-51]
MKIAVCEDNQAEADWLKKVIEKWAADNRMDVQVSCYSETGQFLFAYEESCFDMLFLDVQMPEEDGISLARRLRKKNDSIPIVFVTGMDEYISEGYEVEAVHYLVKPVKEEKVKECLERIAKKLAAGMPYVVLGTEDGVYKVLQKDIVKIEVFARQCFYTTTNGQYAVVQSLKQAQEGLEAGCFKECYRGVLVNLCHIEAVEHNRVLLTGGIEAPVSRRLYGKLNEAFIGYVRKTL